jgi:hypothetical protein
MAFFVGNRRVGAQVAVLLAGAGLYCGDLIVEVWCAYSEAAAHLE